MTFPSDLQPPVLLEHDIDPGDAVVHLEVGMQVGRCGHRIGTLAIPYVLYG